MPSLSYRRWTTVRAHALDGITQAHTALGGTGRGQRHAAQQVNHAYAVLLASQFQGFCRDLHTECASHLLTAMLPALQPVVWTEFTWGRQLDRGNAQPASIGADFGRYGIKFWTEVEAYHPRGAMWKSLLEELNTWRNAIVHQDFDPAKLGGTTVLPLVRVRQWRLVCRRLARAFDEVMRRYLQTLTGTFPW